MSARGCHGRITKPVLTTVYADSFSVLSLFIRELSMQTVADDVYESFEVRLPVQLSMLRRPVAEHWLQSTIEMPLLGRW
jgi:hypothetical protein